MDASLRIGIVEDNDDLRESLVGLLAAHGQFSLGFSCAEDLGERAAGVAFDLMIFDLNLPGEDGLSLVARLKRKQPELRVIMMTTRTALPDRVRGYDLGADLYLPKPVEELELLAAIRALTRQVRSGTPSDSDEASNSLWLDSTRLHLRGGDCAVPLTQFDMALLMALARAPGQRLEHWQLIEAIGRAVDDTGKANLAVRLSRLRSKLVQLGYHGSVLKALRSSGYQLCVPIQIR